MIGRAATAALLTAAVVVSPTSVAAESAATSGEVHASTVCTPAPKPGRIRCRAVVELSLEAARDRKIAWADLRIVATRGQVTPLRGRLGPRDAEIRDPGRVVWSFSLAAASFGRHEIDVRLSVTVAGPAGERTVTQALTAPVDVADP